MKLEEKINILLVDDAPDKLTALESMLTHPGLHLVKAHSGKEALRFLLRQDFALILLDVNMPVMNGFETAAIIRQRGNSEHTPIIFVTADSSQQANMPRGYFLGAVDYIFAPLDPQILIAKVSVFVELFRKSEQNKKYSLELKRGNAILEQKAEELQASRESFLNVVERNVDGIIIADPKKRVRFANVAARALFDLPANIPTRLKLDSFFSYPLKPGKITELAIHKNNGEFLTAEMSVTLTQWEGETAYLASIRDITERKKLEEQLRQSQKLESIGRLAGGIAHDFNNLLTAINGYSALCLEELDGDSLLRSNIEEIKRSGERAAALTSQLLSYSRKQVLAPKVISLNTIIDGMEKMLRRLIGEDIELITKLDPHLRMVKLDFSQMEQAIMNLVVNARDAMPTGGKIVIETSNIGLIDSLIGSDLSIPAGNYVLLTVSDNGVGMDAVIQARLFEPFFTTKEVGKGTGLGLSMVYGFLKQSGGNILVRTEPGRGATFSIYLPSADAGKAGVALHSSASLKNLPRGCETILLVEDELSVLNLLRDTLSMGGYTVLAAGNGLEAIALSERHEGPIDLLLTDVVMQQMGGRELSEKLRELRPGIKVIYMSGYTDDAIVRHGILDSRAAFLQKPFSPGLVSEKIREILTPPE